MNPFRPKTLFLLLFVTAAALCTVPAGAQQEAAKAQILIDQSRIAFMDFMADPNMAWLHQNLKRTKGIMIIPSLFKGGFFWGGSGGRGVLLAHNPETGIWSQPVFYNLGSVSWGLQIGGSKSQIILAVMTQRGLESLFASSFKLGGEVSVAAGPVGVGVGGKGITADMAMFARSMGAFAGASLEGAVIAVNDDWNRVYYGKHLRPTDIIIKREGGNPGSFKLRGVLSEHSK